LPAIISRDSEEENITDHEIFKGGGVLQKLQKLIATEEEEQFRRSGVQIKQIQTPSHWLGPLAMEPREVMNYNSVVTCNSD
jgi:hypothetical protein